MATRIQLRRDTSANWQSNNPVLSSGEVAISTDLNKIKVGNGIATWTSLSYIDSDKAPLNSPTFTGTVTVPILDITASATAGTATSYWVETSSDGIVRPKSLANVKTEIVTTAAVDAALATAVGTIATGTWQGSEIATQYTAAKVTSVNGSTGAIIDLATLTSPIFTGTPVAPTAAIGTNDTQIATTEFVYNAVTRTQSNKIPSSYTLALSDAGKFVEMDVSTSNTLTIPQDSAVNFPSGTSIDVVQLGEGETTIVADTNVNIRSNGGKLKLSGQYSAASLYKRDANDWIVIGDLTL